MCIFYKCNDMKKLLAVGLFTFFGFMTSPLLSGVRRLTAGELKDFANKMVSFHQPTSSGDHSPMPDVSKLDSNVLIAKWIFLVFVFHNNKDVAELVKAVQQGGGWDVSWFYVKPEDTIRIMTLDEWQQDK